MNKVFYITTPIYYVNDTPHIGHSYTTIACDVLSRYQRLNGRETYFLTGTDEHGQKVSQAAKAAGKEPQQLVDEVVEKYKAMWKALNIGNDDFIRTTDPRHEKVVQKLFADLHAKGDIYPGQYEGWYCVPCETFYLETQIEKGLCPDCGRPLEKLKENTYFFRMSKYQDQLLAYIESHPDFVQPLGRYHEIVNFVKSGLRDLSVSRPRSRIGGWGIACPFDQEQVIYVWFDALLNYISAPGYGIEPERFGRVWPADVQVIGKDILKFHAIIWPALLLAAGIELPKKIFAHGCWTIAGEKMSKSRGNVVDPLKISAQFGVDSYRYFLLREVPFGQDGDFSETALSARYQADLANNLGNLLNRTLTMLEKYFAGIVPDPAPGRKTDETLTRLAQALPARIEQHLSELAFSLALERIWEIIDAANRYIENKAPWKLAKTDKEELAAVLYNLVDILRLVAVYLSPFMPKISQLMWEQLGLPGTPAELEITKTSLNQFPGKTRILKGQPLFPKLEINEEGARCS